MLALEGAVTGDSGQPKYSLILVVVAGIIGIGTPLAALGWYLRRRLLISREPHHVQALWLGLLWGAIVLVLAGPLNGIATLLPGGRIYPGIIEEFLKLLLPVILLLASRTYRSPRLGVWLVFVAAAWLGFLEGVSYIITALDPILDGAPVPSEAPFIMMMDVVIRTIAEISHPLMTVGAAVIIWLAAKTLPRGKALGLSLLAYLGAAAIHGLNDAVLNGPVRDWNAPVSIAFTAVYVVAIFVFWFRPQVRRLENHLDDEPARSTTEVAD